MVRVVRWTAGVVVALALAVGCSSSGDRDATPSETPTGLATAPTSDTGTTHGRVREQAAIRAFFALVDEGRAADAVRAMSSSVTGDPSVMQAWAVQLDAMLDVRVVDLRASLPRDWTPRRHTYRVLLSVSMDPASSTAPIPFYGYPDGEHVRFVTVVDEDGTWKVDTIGTGP